MFLKKIKEIDEEREKQLKENNEQSPNKQGAFLMKSQT